MNRNRINGSPANPGRNLRADGEICFPLQQRLFGTAEHGLIQLDACLGPLVGKARKALQQQPRGKDDLDRQSQLRFPARRETAGGALECARLIEQRLGAPVQNFAGRREMRLSSNHLEYLHPEQRFDLLHGVGNRRLALVQHFGCLGIAPRIDHGLQGTP